MLPKKSERHRPWSHRSRPLGFRAALCVAFLLAACGRNQTAPVSDGAESAAAPRTAVAEAAGAPALDQQTEQKLDPLTREDVALYLKVMHAAAGRVKAPADVDRAALASAQALLARHPPAPTPDDAKTLEHATLIAMAMDQIVAQEMNMDSRAYRGIAEAVEAVIPNPVLPAPTGPPGAPPLPDLPATPLQVRLREVNAANEAFLAPYRGEIAGLLAVVRNPATLPR